MAKEIIEYLVFEQGGNCEDKLKQIKDKLNEIIKKLNGDEEDEQ